MKHVIVFALLLWLMSALTASAKNDLEELKLKGRIKTITRTRWQAKPDTGTFKKDRLVSRIIISYNEYGMVYLSSVDCNEHYSISCHGAQCFITAQYSNSKKVFDDNKKLTYEITYEDKDGLQDSTHYTYDASGNISTKKAYDAKGHLSQQFNYVYNEHNKCTKEQGIYDSTTYIRVKSYNANDSVVNDKSIKNNTPYFEQIYSYDSLGSLVEEVCNRQDKRFYKYTFLYDKKHRLIDNIEYGESDTMNWRYQYTYNNTGNKIITTSYDYTQQEATKITKTHYEKNGNPTTEDIYKNNKLSMHTIFDSRGNRAMSVEYFYNTKGAIQYKHFIKTTYDIHNKELVAQGRSVEGNGSFSSPQTYKYGDVGFYESHTYKYDKEDNLILQVDYANNKAELITETEIAYY